ncbi:tape measure protein [Mycobacterium haemophilum]|uniref:tape measure protein n=1 Tax=Mycobacterium haemophilum TaxID=29311 RepID=UPI00069C83FE|nr:tape measure protein [Mycobacterium haemophilum]
MAIHAAVETRLDERAARQTASQLTAQFSKAGQVDIVAKLNQRAVTDATNKLKSELARAGTVSGEAFNQALQAQSNRTKIATDTLRAELERQFASHGVRAGNSFGGAFGAQMARSIPGVSGFATALAGYEGAAAKTGAVAGRAMGMAFTAAATGLVGAGAYTLFKGFQRYEAIDAAKNRLDNLNRTLAATHKQTVDVGAVMKTVEQVVLDTPFALDKAFSVATRALGSATGDLRRFMTDVADAAAYAQAPIDDVGQAFLKIANQQKLSMEEVQNELRNTNILGWLQETMHVSGAELAKMIHDNKVGLEQVLQAVEFGAPGLAKKMGETIQGALENVATSVSKIGANVLGAIFGQPAEDSNRLADALLTLKERLDRVGAWVNEHQDDIRKAFETAAKVGGDLLKVVGEIAKALSEHPALVYAMVAGWGAFEALKIASMFANITTAIGGTTAAVGGLSAALAAIALPVELLALLPLLKGSATPPNIGPGADDRKAKLEAGRQYFDQHHQMPPGYQHWLDNKGAMPPEMGPYYHAPGTTIGGTTLPWQAAPGAPMRVWTGQGWVEVPSGPAGPGPAGGPILPPTGAGDGSGHKGPRLPVAPQVPYGAEYFAGPRPGESAALYSAESSLLEARHTVEMKRARLQQLEHTNTATAEDILDAKNDLAKAQRDQFEAELRLNQTRQSEFEKATKQMRQGANTLGEIGAQLDQDLGISKGLAGIAENITRFVASLAAAPVIGALSGVQMGMGYKPGEAGSGLLAMAAGAGMFGPQHQMLPWGGQQFGGAVGFPTAMPGMAGANPNVNAMLSLAQWSSGRTKYAPASDLVNGLADCSGAISDLYEVLTTGQTTPGRQFTTTNFASDAKAAELGFLPGYMPGAFNIGVTPLPWSSGHMAATLPNGVNFEGGGGTGGGAQYGGSAAGAMDPQFSKHYYLPVGGPSAAPAGMGGGGIPGGPAPGVPGVPAGPGIPGAPAPIPGAPGTPGVPFPGGPTLIPGGGGPGQLGGPGTSGPRTVTPDMSRYPNQGLNLPASPGGISISGGLAGMLQGAIPQAIGAAGLGADVMGGFGGGSVGAAIASAAAQIGIEEINRGIKVWLPGVRYWRPGLPRDGPAQRVATGRLRRLMVRPHRRRRRRRQDADPQPRRPAGRRPSGIRWRSDGRAGRGAAADRAGRQHRPQRQYHQQRRRQGLHEPPIDGQHTGNDPARLVPAAGTPVDELAADELARRKRYALCRRAQLGDQRRSHRPRPRDTLRRRARVAIPHRVEPGRPGRRGSDRARDRRLPGVLASVRPTSRRLRKRAHDRPRRQRERGEDRADGTRSGSQRAGPT